LKYNLNNRAGVNYIQSIVEMLDDYEAATVSNKGFKELYKDKCTKLDLCNYNVLIVDNLIWKGDTQQNELIIPSSLSNEFEEITSLNLSFEKNYLSSSQLKRKIKWDHFSTIIELEADFNGKKYTFITSALHGFILLLFSKSKQKRMELNQILKSFNSINVNEEVSSCLLDLVLFYFISLFIKKIDCKILTESTKNKEEFSLNMAFNYSTQQVKIFSKEKKQSLIKKGNNSFF